MDYYRQKKILTSQECIAKTTDKSKVFVSGVFDLLHIGHINFLRKAKEIVGNRGYLIIALHDDNSVKLHKGPQRPIMNLYQRLEFLSELECVDFVVPWEGWENIIDFALELKPQYFAITKKSYDHTTKNEWLGKTWEEVARLINAQLIEISITQGLSTTYLEQALNSIGI